MSRFQTEWFSIDPSMTWDEMMEALDKHEKRRYEIQRREQKERHEMQSRIHELETALLAIRGLVQIKASTVIHSFARGDVLRIIDEALSEDNKNG